MIQTLKVQVYDGETSEDSELVFEYDEQEDYLTVYLGKKYICGISDVEDFKKLMKEAIERW